LIEVSYLPLEGDGLVIAPDELQAAQQVPLAGLRSRPERAHGELAIRVVTATQVAAHRHLASRLDIARVDRRGDLEQVIVHALDEGRLVRRALRPVQAGAGIGVAEDRVRAGARAGGGVRIRVPRTHLHDGDNAADEQSDQQREQRLTRRCVFASHRDLRSHGRSERAIANSQAFSGGGLRPTG
jgi:hypothetical protein